jgi:cell division protein ZapA
MGQVTITLNGRTYRLRCGDGEEARVIALAEHVEGKLAGLVAEFGQVGDERLLVMAAIMVTDELFDAREKAAMPSAMLDPETVVAAEIEAHATSSDSPPATAPAALAAPPPKTGVRSAHPPPAVLTPASPPVVDRPGEPALQRAMRRHAREASIPQAETPRRNQGQP